MHHIIQTAPNAFLGHSSSETPFENARVFASKRAASSALSNYLKHSKGAKLVPVTLKKETIK